ncbi:MAG TPA: hypothetical protein DCE41_00720 [Cytophagales bacterium]|nr:hypothetical protein [Cytophagales bacterium]HAP64022.1 hypothetical protein [Cytophagales bacterium]
MPLLLLLSYLSFSGNPGLSTAVNQEVPVKRQTVTLGTQDSVTVWAEAPVYWVVYQPVLREYDNLKEGAWHLEEIEYQPVLLSSVATTKQTFRLSAGTYLVGTQTDTTLNPIATIHPLHLQRTGTLQMVVQESDDYVGYLTELLGLPFVIPPKLLGNYGHQTDLRVGTDCAELAIYGRRRMGHPVPYGGPRGIREFLVPTDSVVPGTVVHYGFQVSVVYQDRGQPGLLDAEDLLIHAYQTQVAIERLGDVALWGMPYQLYQWKESTFSPLGK